MNLVMEIIEVDQYLINDHDLEQLNSVVKQIIEVETVMAEFKELYQRKIQIRRRIAERRYAINMRPRYRNDPRAENSCNCGEIEEYLLQLQQE